MFGLDRYTESLMKKTSSFERIKYFEDRKELRQREKAKASFTKARKSRKKKK